MAKQKKVSASTSTDDGASSHSAPTILDLYNLMVVQGKQLQQLTRDNETLAAHLQSIEEKLTASQKVVQFLKEENQALKKHVDDLQFDVYEMKQEQLSNNLVISGAGTLVEGKSLTENLEEIAANLGKTLDVTNINDIYTIRRRSGTQLVVKFARAQQKMEIMDQLRIKRRDAQTSGAQFPLANLFFSDHLTPYFENLWYRCRLLKKKSSLAHAWTKMGKLFVRKEEGGHAIRICNINDLSKIYSEYGLEVSSS
jgi:hypothetical protein